MATVIGSVDLSRTFAGGLLTATTSHKGESKGNTSFLYSPLAKTKAENNVILRVNKLSK